MVVYRCADARGGGIGSTRGSPSESGTFHCRTRGGRIAIVLSLSIRSLLFRSWKTFPRFPAEGNFGSRVELVRNGIPFYCFAYVHNKMRVANASYLRITGTG